MTEIIIHGKSIDYNPNLEYGLYFPTGPMNFQQYSSMGISETVKKLNDLDVKEVIEQAKILKKMAEEQMNWISVPGIIGEPILKLNRNPVPINEVKDNIKNTKDFANNLIKILEDKN